MFWITRLPLPLAHCHLGKLTPPLMNQHQLSLQLNCTQALVGQDQLGWANTKTQSDCTMQVCQTHFEDRHTFPDGKPELEPKLTLKSEANKIQSRSQRRRSVNQIQARAGPDRCSLLESPRRSAQSQRSAKQQGRVPGSRKGTWEMPDNIQQ